jgi:hypothetical protein
VWTADNMTAAGGCTVDPEYLAALGGSRLVAATYALADRPTTPPLSSPAPSPRKDTAATAGAAAAEDTKIEEEETRAVSDSISLFGSRARTRRRCSPSLPVVPADCSDGITLAAEEHGDPSHTAESSTDDDHAHEASTAQELHRTDGTCVCNAGFNVHNTEVDTTAETSIPPHAAVDTAARGVADADAEMMAPQSSTMEPVACPAQLVELEPPEATIVLRRDAHTPPHSTEVGSESETESDAPYDTPALSRRDTTNSAALHAAANARFSVPPPPPSPQPAGAPAATLTSDTTSKPRRPSSVSSLLDLVQQATDTAKQGRRRRRWFTCICVSRTNDDA